MRHRNKDWWKQNFNRERMIFLNMCWFFVVVLFSINQYSFALKVPVVIIILISLIGLTLSHKAHVESKFIRELYKKES